MTPNDGYSIPLNRGERVCFITASLAAGQLPVYFLLVFGSSAAPLLFSATFVRPWSRTVYGRFPCAVAFLMLVRLPTMASTEMPMLLLRPHGGVYALKTYVPVRSRRLHVVTTTRRTSPQQQHHDLHTHYHVAKKNTCLPLSGHLCRFSSPSAALARTLRRTSRGGTRSWAPWSGSKKSGRSSRRRGRRLRWSAFRQVKVPVCPPVTIHYLYS